MRRPKVDLNQPIESTPSTPCPDAKAQGQNFMPMTPFLLHNHQETKEDEEETRNSCLMQRQKQSIDMFWNQQRFEIYNTTVFKSNQLPLARIKRVMKANGEVKMISAETAIIFAKACELFIQELTLRAWLQTEECKRRTLHRCDIARALRQDELLDFLVDFVPFSHFYQDDEGDKSLEEINELHPANKQYFPAVDVNGNFIANPRKVL